MQLPTVGKRFISRKLIDRAHEFTVPELQVGTVVRADKDVIIVKMENPIVGCAEEWDNSIIYNQDDAPECGSLPKEFYEDFQSYG